MTQGFRERAGALPSSTAAPPEWVRPAGLCLLAAAGLAMFLAPLRGVDLGHMNGLGLISALPAISLAGAGVLVVAFVAALGLARPYPAVLAGMLAAIVCCLDGVTAIVEAQPGQASAYQAAGIAQYISHGHPVPGGGIYSGWPGFYALIALAGDALGARGLIPVLRLWPVAISLLWLLPLFLMTRNMRATWQARWFAALLFCVGNWVGQNYFSPESYGFLLYLLFLAILLTWFRATPGTLPPRPRRGDGQGWWRWRGPGLLPGELPYVPVSRGQQAVLLASLIVIFTVTVASYPLAAFLQLAACLGLVVARRCTLTRLPVLLLVIGIAWFSFVAARYWSGQLLPSIRSLVSAGGSVPSAITGTTTTAHVGALEAGLLFAVILVFLAAVGRQRRRARFLDDRCMLVLACTPVLVLGIGLSQASVAQAYLFALPALCVLAAYSFFPGTQAGRASWPAVTAAAACAVVLTGAFFLARYASEAYEQVPGGELTAMDYVYAHDSSGARLLWLSSSPATASTPAMPWQYRGIGKIDYIPVQAPPNPDSIGHLVSVIRRSGPGTYLMLTRTQVTELQQSAGYPPGWGEQFRQQMSAAHGVQVAFANGDAAIYTLHWPRGVTRRPLPANAAVHGRAPAGSWTRAGLAVLVLLLAVLVAREFIAVSRPASRRSARPLTWLSLPLLAVFAVVIAERIITLR
jgi:hypothetical protein